MYQFPLRLFVVILLFAGTFSAGKSNPVIPPADATTDCPLPAPTGLTITNVTPTSISLAWNPGLTQAAVYYRVRFFDQTDQFQLPDVIVFGQTTYTRTGLLPGHTYDIDVSASACPDGPFGEAARVVGRTSEIIVDLIVQNSCQNLGAGENKPASTTETITLVPASTTNQTVQVKHFKIFSNAVPSAIVDFNLWADCDFIPHFGLISQQNVQQYQMVTQDGKILLIGYNTVSPPGSFFTISEPSYDQGLTRVTLTYNSSCTLRRCTGNTGSYTCPGLGSGGEGEPREAQSGDAPGQTDMSLLVVPNPTPGEFQAEYTLPSESGVRFDLFDATGRMLKTVETPGALSAGAHVTAFDLHELPSGLYFLALQTNEGRRVTTVVKQ